MGTAVAVDPIGVAAGTAVGGTATDVGVEGVTVGVPSDDPPQPTSATNMTATTVLQMTGIENTFIYYAPPRELGRVVPPCILMAPGAGQPSGKLLGRCRNRCRDLFPHLVHDATLVGQKRSREVRCVPDETTRVGVSAVSGRYSRLDLSGVEVEDDDL